MFVFLIDSNPMITDWLKKQSAQLHFPFYSLKSLKESLYFIQDLAPDVVVIDEKSVDLTNEDLVSALIEYPLLKEIPVIGFGKTLPEWMGRLNMKGHLSKPVDPSTFHALVKELLGTN
ncbi:MAG: hypothetical protein K2P81_14385 [Bacteriovoracaceae bacterium]|nr:hypothetical protein [Bacteriovoracaceae bacterium]